MIGRLWISVHTVALTPQLLMGIPRSLSVALPPQSHRLHLGLIPWDPLFAWILQSGLVWLITVASALQVFMPPCQPQASTLLWLISWALAQSKSLRCSRTSRHR